MTSTSSLLFSPTLPSTRRTQFSTTRKPKKIRSAPMSISAIRREAADHYGSGRLVDENLIVLRKRIHEMKMIERNYEPPAEWMDWEKNFYTSYDSMICEAMGILQSQLMNTRPCLALGIIALVTLSVPISTGLGFVHLIDLTRGVLDGIHMLG